MECSECGKHFTKEENVNGCCAKTHLENGRHSKKVEVEQIHRLLHKKNSTEEVMKFKTETF
jgi:hypothetical protein